MLRAPSSPSPTSAKTNKMAAPKTVPRIAASLLRFSEYPWGSAAKIGARPNGSTTTISVTNELKTKSTTFLL